MIRSLFRLIDSKRTDKLLFFHSQPSRILYLAHFAVSWILSLSIYSCPVASKIYLNWFRARFALTFAVTVHRTLPSYISDIHQRSSIISLKIFTSNCSSFISKWTWLIIANRSHPAPLLNLCVEKGNTVAIGIRSYSSLWEAYPPSWEVFLRKSGT